MSFELNHVFPGVIHIRDAMGVCMTLLQGTNRALLVDTGYGAEDVYAFVRTLTDLPLDVLLTHHHHDHALGARCFPRTMMLAADQAEFAYFTGPEMRRRVLGQARRKGLDPNEEEFLGGEIAQPEPLEPGTMDLGGLTAQIIACPGHTPGSAVVYIPEYRLLLSADNWNPCTWLFFAAALGAQDYRRNMQRILELPFEHVLCSHQIERYDRAMVEAFLGALDDDALRGAQKVVIPPYTDVDTRQVNLPQGQILVFDYAKTNLNGEE